MKATVVVIIHGVTFTYNFNSITEAYHFYLYQFSTLGEWWYYLRCAHRLLDSVKDEQVMESIFKNVFNKNVCLLVDKQPLI